MRKFSSFMAAAVAMLAAVSCNKEINNIDPVTPGTDAVVYTAYVDGAETKTSLGATEGEGEWVNTTTRTQWDANDKITIHTGIQGYTFKASEINGGSAKFTCEDNDFNAGEGVMAVYPAGNYTVNVENKTVNAYIPTYQGAREGDYNEAAALAVAYSKNNELRFKNATALLKFRVNSTNIKAIEFYGHNNDAITGNVQVSLNIDDNTVKSVEGLMTTFTWEDETTTEQYGTWVKFYSEDEANNWCLKTETDYYVAIAPHTFEKGVAVNLILADDTKVEKYKSFADPLTIEPSTILDLGSFEYSPAAEDPEVTVGYWAVVGTMSEWGDYAKLTLDGEWHVATDVKLTVADQFKFRADENWAVNRGAEGEVDGVEIADNVETSVFSDGRNFSVAENGMYSVYINKAATKVKVVRTGDIPLPSAKNWGIVGSITGWGSSSDIAMTLTEDWYVAHDVEMPAGTEFKFRTDETWANDGGEELTYAGAVTSGKEYNVSKGSSNISVTTAAIYDVYLSHDETKMKVVKVGDLEEPAINAKDGCVYLLPNSNWTQSNAWFAIYLCNGKSASTWIKMTKIEGTAYYEAELPDDFDATKYKNIIFCRMNPASQTLDWSNKWNQSGDLECSNITSGKNSCAINNGQWDCGSNVTWTTITQLN